MEDLDQDAPGASERVSILSTLESARRAARRTPAASTPKTAARMRWPRMLAIAGGLTACAALLWTFASLLMARSAGDDDKVAMAAAPTQVAQTPSAAAQVGPATAVPGDAAASAPHVAQADPLAALRGAAEPAQVPAKAASLPATQNPPAVIETVATATPPAGQADTPLSGLTKAPGQTAAQTSQRAPQAAPIQPPAPAAAPAAVLPQPAPAAKVATSVTAARPAPTAELIATRGKATERHTAERTGTSNTKDDDVALLEAMFARNSAHRGAASASEELRRCASLEAPSADACRTKVCRQHPKTAGCPATSP